MTAVAVQGVARPMGFLTQESAESGTLRDLGTYEVVEGSLAKAAVDLYFSGRKLDGHWRFIRTEAPRFDEPFSTSASQTSHDRVSSLIDSTNTYSNRNMTVVRQRSSDFV